MTEQNYYNNNIGLLSLPIYSMNNPMQNNINIHLNSHNNLPTYPETNLNINKLLLLNQNKNIPELQLNNHILQDLNSFNKIQNDMQNNFQNNYYNNNNKNYYSIVNNKLIRPYLSTKEMLLSSPSLTKANDLIYKDLAQIEKVLTNYKYYIINNNNEAIDMCLKYILENNFFFDQSVTKKIEGIFRNIMYNKNSSDETFKYKLKEIFQKMIPMNIKENYLNQYYKPKSEKNLSILIKKDLNINKNYKDNIYYLSEIFEIIKCKLNNKDIEEIKNLINKYIYAFNHQSFNNNNYYNTLPQNKNGGNYSNNNTFNSYKNNNYRKHSFQSQSNNFNDTNYNHSNNFINGNNNNYHKYSNYNHNYIDDKNNDQLGYHKTYHSPYNKKNNYKGSYSSRHYFNDKNNNKIKNKSNRKNSSYGTGGFLVEVSTTPKKEENEIDDDVKKDEVENKEDIKEEEKNENNIIHNNSQEENKKLEDENIVINKKDEDVKEESDLLLTNEINISQEMDKEKNPDNNDNYNKIEDYIHDNINNDFQNDNYNVLNKDMNDSENEDKMELNINEDNNINLQEDNLITDFNSLNPFNDNNNKEDEINNDKEDSSNNLRAFKSAQETKKINIDKEYEDNNSEDNNENNDYILNIINNSDNIFNNMNLNEEEINKEDNKDHIEQNIENNININLEEKNNDIINQENIINEDSNNKKDSLLNASPKKEIIFSNSANNINDRINLNNENSQNNLNNNMMNYNQDNLRSVSDNNLLNMNNNNLKKNANDININDNNFQNNFNNYNLSNEQLQLFRLFMQNNSLLNANIPKPNLNNNIFSNSNNITMNLFNNINSGMNLINQINENVLNINNNFTGIYNNNENQNYINILVNYLDQKHNLLSELKPNSKNKNIQFNNQQNLDYLKLKSEKITNEYNTKIKNLKENNPSLVKENMNLFEEKIILPIYQKICEENQQKKEIYTNTFNKYKNLIMKVLTKNNVQDTKIEPYGSIVNNFMTENGDIDICLIPSDLNLISDFDKYLEEIKEEIVKVQKCAEFVILENYAKFMILKLKDIESEIDLDITVQPILPIINTKLVRLYSLYDQRFHIIGIFLKFWVKKNHIHGSLDKYLSSYALLILIIHYLQTIIEPKVLPMLQQVHNQKKEYIYFNGEKEITTNLYFEEDLDEIKNYMKIINGNEDNENSIVELIVGFFEYYAYKYNHYMISISRSDKIPVDENETIAFPLEDPFDIGYNPGKSMKLNSLPYTAFIYCMKKELKNIISGEYFKYNGE